MNGILNTAVAGVLLFVLSFAFPGSATGGDMKRLELRNGHFVKSDGKTERFWGVNMVSAFPDHSGAEKIAGDLASLGVNLVRPHHLLRSSKDWVWHAPCSALIKYEKDSREPDAEAWDRFDYLNAALRKRGIRLVLSMHFTRRFLPGDAAIIPGGDSEAWSQAIEELNSWHWQKSFDPIKLLPVLDERARLLQKEFVKRLLAHRNPYTGLTYGEDPQVLYMEIVNESSLEYALICNNQFPAYFEEKLQAAWRNFAKEDGATEPGNFREINNSDMVKLRSRFFLEYEKAYFADMKDFAVKLSPDIKITCSNLWRGEDALELNLEVGDVVEDHFYVHPLVVGETGAWPDVIAKTLVEGRPYFAGEFNFSENADIMREFAYARPMLMLAAAAYGSFHDIDGIAWYAYNHGDTKSGTGGVVTEERRVPALGDMATDGVAMDHMATCAAIFRNICVKPSVSPVIREIQIPVAAGGYHQLMNERNPLPQGAMAKRSYRKRLTRLEVKPVKIEPEAGDNSRLVSDTGEIIQDINRKQLSVVSARSEAFSGFLDENFPQHFSHLKCSDSHGFATVIAVAADDMSLDKSERILVSRTWMDEAGTDIKGLDVSFEKLKSEKNGEWKMRVIRPKTAAEVLVDLAGSDAVPVESKNGIVKLPPGTWTQIELIYMARQAGQ